LIVKTNIGEETYTYKSSGVIKANKYYHIVVQYNGTELAVIFDGNKMKSFFINGGINYSSNNLLIGHKEIDGKIAENLNGAIYKFKVTDEFYSMSHLRLLFNDAITFETSDKIIGDVNNDGKFNTLDALNILKYCAKMIVIEGDNLIAADVNSDGVVNTIDSLTILKVLAKVE
ncbi:MAG: dockerin type I domain-containing protein, partial [Oscillospiraceae bacterium]